MDLSYTAALTLCESIITHFQKKRLDNNKEVVFYTIQATKGVEWTVQRRYSEFLVLRDVLALSVPATSRVEAPLGSPSVERGDNRTSRVAAWPLSRRPRGERR